MNFNQILKMAPGFLYMLGSALLAAWSIDLIAAGLFTGGGALSFFGGIVGLVAGILLIFRYVYQFDRAKGRVKRKIKLFE